MRECTALHSEQHDGFLWAITVECTTAYHVFGSPQPVPTKSHPARAFHLFQQLTVKAKRLDHGPALAQLIMPWAVESVHICTYGPRLGDCQTVATDARRGTV